MHELAFMSACIMLSTPILNSVPHTFNRMVMYDILLYLYTYINQYTIYIYIYIYNTCTCIDPSINIYTCMHARTLESIESKSDRYIPNRCMFKYTYTHGTHTHISIHIYI